jgi:hypothetical protein
MSINSGDIRQVILWTSARRSGYTPPALFTGGLALLF